MSVRERLRCALRGHDWYEFRANFVTVEYVCADCGRRQRERPTRDRTAAL